MAIELEPVASAPLGTFRIKGAGTSPRYPRCLTKEEIVVASAFSCRNQVLIASYDYALANIPAHSAISKALRTANARTFRTTNIYTMRNSLRRFMSEHGIIGEPGLLLDITVSRVLALNIRHALYAHPYSEWVLRAFHGDEIVDTAIAAL